MSFFTKTILEVVHPYAGMSEEMVEEFRNLWRDSQLGNDYYYYSWYDELDEDYPLIAKYIRDSGEDENNILIHFWW